MASSDPPRSRLDAAYPLREAVRETLRTLEHALTRTLAHELYQAEKADLLNHPLLNANPDRLEHWSQAYDAHFPFDEHTPYLQVTPRVRQLLGRAVQRRLIAPRQTTLFAVQPAAVQQPTHLPPVATPQTLFQHLGTEAGVADARRRRLAAPVEEEQLRQSIRPVRGHHLESHS